jgi:hypothetical protein
LFNRRLKLEAQTKESLQYRIVQFPRDVFTLPSAFVNANREFPVVVVIDAAIKSFDNLGWTTRPDGYCDFVNRCWLDLKKGKGDLWGSHWRQNRCSP